MEKKIEIILLFFNFTVYLFLSFFPTVNPPLENIGSTLLVELGFNNSFIVGFSGSIVFTPKLSLNFFFSSHHAEPMLCLIFSVLEVVFQFLELLGKF